MHSSIKATKQKLYDLVFFKVDTINEIFRVYNPFKKQEGKIKKQYLSKIFLNFTLIKIKSRKTTNSITNQEQNKLEFSLNKYTRAKTFDIIKGFVNFQHTRGTHRVIFINDNCYDSFGPPQKTN